MEQRAHQMGELGDLLGRTRVGLPFRTAGLTIVPLFTEAAGRDAVLLEEATEAGTVSMTEHVKGAQVGAIQVAYTGKGHLLLLDGEEILGAKQNRIFNTSFLIKAGAPVTIPVSCVEQGRWRHTSRRFSSSGRTLSSRARRKKLERLTRSVTTRDEYDADQGSLWNDVSEYLSRSAVDSATQAFSEAAESRAADIEREIHRFEPRPAQNGMAGVREGKVVALDLFSSSRLFARAWRKLASGLLLEGYYSRQAEEPGAVRLVDQALATLASSPVVRKAAPGVGYTLHGESQDLAISAVADDGAVYHVFAASCAGGDDETAA